MLNILTSWKRRVRLESDTFQIIIYYYILFICGICMITNSEWNCMLENLFCFSGMKTRAFGVMQHTQYASTSAINFFSSLSFL